jgi:hypothetical protein
MDKFLDFITGRTLVGKLLLQKLTLTVADGTPPLTVTSTTKVVNLNADKWDGYDINYEPAYRAFTIK